MGKKTTTIEMDNFLLDRDFRDDKPMGKETTHFKLFKHMPAGDPAGKEDHHPAL